MLETPMDKAIEVPVVFPVLAKSREALTTRTLHSELVYNYSGSRQYMYILAARFDASHAEDGKINYQEFVAMMKNNSPEIVPNRRRLF
ncbi:hypothetical protein BRADI_3g18772v3 [Brachypodium distachyon]|uniref:EF-hand domain-containing protein n=1 Tax=Brachypodium distachyon TaxID=15368 RepID=A0A2K2CY38_BRADI|nr:hypothetical protein BRADI_3g18772v3 [Brachypodium distachyon]